MTPTDLDSLTQEGSAVPEEEDSQARRYRAAADILRERMARQDPADAAVLDDIRPEDVWVVPGQYDHVDLVMNALRIPYRLVTPAALEAWDLVPDQLLVINCPGQLSPRAVERVREFVRDGGSLFTTDWALRHVLEPAFPGVLAYNERPTRDDVVRIEVLDRENPFLRGVMEGADDPQWWLEVASFPITILAPNRVQVLIQSQELEKRYGEAAVSVLFPYGQGEVFHMISHYYLQRTELRTKRHGTAASAYATEKGSALTDELRERLSGLSLGEVESAHTTLSHISRILIEKQKRARRPKQ